MSRDLVLGLALLATVLFVMGAITAGLLAAAAAAVLAAAGSAQPTAALRPVRVRAQRRDPR